MLPFRGRLRIRHLEIVLAITDFGSLSNAASRLHMTQSGLSRAITEIEDIAGGRLFERTGKGMVCTALGAALYRHAHIVLADLDKAEMDLQAIAEGSQGSLTVGCFSLFSGWPMVEAVQMFQARQPGVALSLEFGMHDRLIEELDASRIDLLVSRRAPSLNPESYGFTDLMGDSVVLACASGHPLAGAGAGLTLADCACFPWIAPPPKNRVRIEIEALLRHQGTRLPAMVGALSLEFSLRLVEDGHHLWLLPGSVAERLSGRSQLRQLPIDLGLGSPPLAAIWRLERLPTPHVLAFVAALSEAITTSRSA